ncbi:MAG: alpha/beta hydrolase domain-containing protein, partial [Acidobacteria bacterium]|nr:alpha/beta hydrolase domain-containing protein [Acidobacteriota bacterium]
RMASGDSRLSLEERYPGGEAEYVRRYGEAADALVAGRYLLPADAETLKKSAAAAWRAAVAAP